MESADKTREQLLIELAALRQQVMGLEQQVETLTQHCDRLQQTPSSQSFLQQGKDGLSTWRMALLQEITASLAGALTSAEIFEILLHQGSAALNATRGWIAQRQSVDPNVIEIVKTIGCSTQDIEAHRHVDLNQAMPATDVIRTGQRLIIQSPEEYCHRYPHLVDRFMVSGSQSLVVFPLIIQGQVLGSLGWSFAEPQAFTEADCSFMIMLARQCAQALERAHLYEAERLARESAEAASRVKDEFLAVLSHELRSPLNPILGWTKMLRSRRFDARMTDRALDSIERNAKLQIQLIEDLLDVSHILQGKLRLNISTVNLVPVIMAALETVQLAAASKSIALQVTYSDLPADLPANKSANPQFDPSSQWPRRSIQTDVATDSTPSQAKLDVPEVYVAGDPARLQQIVWNLVSNAIKFTPAEGKVEITLSAIKHPTENYQAEILVRDTGKGIAPAFLPFVFDYFRQADSTLTRQFGGLGLGLTIVRHLVELHGGSIQAESQGEGQGASFRVSLPLLRSSDRASATSVKTAHPPLPRLAKQLHQARILVVDDDADMRDYVEAVLLEAGARVALASSAGEALAKLSRFRPHVLISDIGMPNVDGYMLLKQIRTLMPELGGQVPAIALTAYAGEYNQQQTLAAGFQLHIAKPVEPEALVTAVANLLPSQAEIPSLSEAQQRPI